MPSKKIALVTGAAGVMGLAVTRMYLKNGIFVVMADWNEKELKRTSEEFGDKVLPLPMDVSNHDEVLARIRYVTETIGAPTILVNNAGVFSATKVVNTEVKEWRRVMGINLDGAFFVAKAVLPGMREKKWGRIINVSSYAAKSGGITAGTAYSVSKGGMISLTFSLAAETTGDGITVNGIAPAWIRTPMVTDLSPEQQEETRNRIPVKRFCEPEEFSHVVEFLSAENAGFITGEIIDLNGGVHFD